MRVRALWLVLWLAAASTLFGAEIERRYAPTIGIGGVVNAASFRAAPDDFIVPNGIISIFGVDLSLRTKGVGFGDLDRGQLPISLGGVTVDIGGIAAPLYFVSPGQINAQAPALPAAAQVRVRVFREGLLSNEVFVKVAAIDPAIFVFFSRPIITHLDYTFIGRGEFEGSTPAHPGEYIVIFATGMGRTVPPVLAGQLPTYTAAVETPVRVRIAGRLLEGAPFIQYAGQAPGLAGLYQINVLLPGDISLGDPEILVEMGESVTQSGLLLAVDPAPAAAPDE